MMFVLVLAMMMVMMVLAFFRFLVPTAAATTFGSLEERTELPGTLSLLSILAVTVTTGA